MALHSVELFKFLEVVANNGGANQKVLGMLGLQSIIVSEEFFYAIKQMGIQYDESVKKKWEMNKKELDAYDFFLGGLGFKEVYAVDYTDFEGANIICDLNKKCPNNLEDKFDYLIDGGTLEHVFNVPQAMENIVRMVRQDGIIFHISPVAGFVNHGFYSFSPTFYQDFYGVNKCNILKMELLFERTIEVIGESITKSIEFSSIDLRLLPKKRESEVNDYTQALFEKEMTVLALCMVKINKLNPLIFPIQGFYARLYGNDGKGYKKSLDLDAIAKSLDSDKRIGLYGVGYYCDKFLDKIVLNGKDDCVSVLFDSDISKENTQYRGYDIFYPTADRLNSCDYIYICSSGYYDEIKNTLLKFGYPQERIMSIHK